MCAASLPAEQELASTVGARVPDVSVVVSLLDVGMRGDGDMSWEGQNRCLDAGRGGEVEEEVRAFVDMLAMFPWQSAYGISVELVLVIRDALGAEGRSGGAGHWVEQNEGWEAAARMVLVSKQDLPSAVLGAKEESARGPGKAGEAALARAAAEKKPPPPPEALWVAAAAILAAAGAAVSRFAPRDVSFSVAFAPSYLAATVATYLASTRVPARLQRVGLFPTITGGIAMALVSAGVGAATGAGAIGGIREYCDGAGRVLLYFVPPAVLGLAFRVKAQRRALEANFAAVAVAVAVPGGFAVAAALGRALGLPAWLTLATVPKCTTTGLAVSMAAQIGADPSLVAAGCALSGTAGLAAGRALMDLAGVRGAVPRGVATGCSSHAAGTAGLAAGGEEEAAAVSGVAFAFAGVLGVALLEWGACRAALGVIAGAPVGA